jgi:arsenate reductase
VSRPLRLLFVCVHNAGRSQMAAAFARAMGGAAVEARSAGSDPAPRVNPVVVEAMAEVGIDLSGAKPRRLEEADGRDADRVVTMGCGDACPAVPSARREDWAIEDPAGRDLETVRRVREDVRRRVAALLAERLGPRAPRGA